MIEANGRFDLRSRVVESAAPASPEEVNSALDVLKTPEERKAAASPPAAYELHDRDAIAVLGDNFVVDARIDIEASSGFFRIFRIDVAPDRWLLVPKVRDQPFATLIASKDAYSPQRRQLETRHSRLKRAGMVLAILSGLADKPDDVRWRTHCCAVRANPANGLSFSNGARNSRFWWEMRSTPTMSRSLANRRRLLPVLSRNCSEI